MEEGRHKTRILKVLKDEKKDSFLDPSERKAAVRVIQREPLLPYCVGSF
jgi:hypothetical protein